MKIDSALQFSFSGQAHLHSRRPLSGPSGASSFGIRFKLCPELGTFELLREVQMLVRYDTTRPKLYFLVDDPVGHSFGGRS